MTCAKEKEVLLNVLELYKDMPYLWQKDHKDYSNKNIRNDGFKVLLKIYKKFDESATIKTLKRKLDNMRSNYARELRKVASLQHTDAGANDVYKPSLWYFETLSFLGARTESCGETLYPLDYEVILEAKTESCRETLDPLDYEESSNEDNISSIPTSKNNGSQKRKKQYFEKQEKLLQTAKKMMARNEEEWEIFGKLVGRQMKDLDKTQLTICQKIISEAIFYARLNKLSEESHIVLSNEFT